MDVGRRVTRARAQLILKQPFWGNLAMHLHVRQIRESDIPNLAVPCLTMGTDGKTLIYHAPYVESLDDEALKTTVAHEVGHCILGHPWRRQHREVDLWNIAADMAINQILKESGFTFKNEKLFPPQLLEHASTERLYAWLQEQTEAYKNECKNQHRGGHEGWGTKHTHDAVKMAAELHAMWKANVAAAAQALKQSRGTLPAGLERLVGQLMEPRVDWRTILAQFMVSVAYDDYTYQRVRKAYIVGARAAYQPRLHSERIRLAVGVDTSGSISQEMLTNFASEVHAILYGNNGASMIIYACDADVNATYEIGPEDPIPDNFPGGGGTDFRPVFDKVEEEWDEPPDALVYFTDSYGAFPDKAPEYPVLWIVDADPSAYADIPFGEVVEYIETPAVH